MGLSAPGSRSLDRGIRGAPGDGNRQASVFVGQWAPTLLILGLYNKLVKQLGSDSPDNRVTAQRGTR